MKLNNVGNFSTINAFVEHKISVFSKEEKTFKNLFNHMFSESENIMAETSDGFRIKKVTYGECKNQIFKLAGKLNGFIGGVEKGSIIGLYMSNSLEWIELFWAILMCGYNPLLMNSRLPDSELEKILAEHNVKKVVSDGKQFSVDTILAEQILSAEENDKFESGCFGEKVFFCSSGTTDNVKLCAYTAENFFYQIKDSFNIVQSCPQISKHYEGELKILALLPLYHVFGFIAVYMWFGFFSRTFVFVKDLSAQTVLNTVKKHKVTHIFLVPLVWEKIYAEALKGIKARGEKTFKKFEKALDFVCKHEKLGSILQKKAFKEIREKLFGESIKFLISGGSGIAPEVIKFFNGIGYHMANGYGMTEVGITSLETSMKRKIRCLSSVGAPFSQTQYSVKDGQLLIKGKTRASQIIQGDKVIDTDFDAWFETGDLVEERDGRYFILGRRDDLVIGPAGENLNPEIIEKQVEIKDAEALCLIAGKDSQPTLIVEIKGWLLEKEEQIRAEINEALKNANVLDQIKKVVLTSDKLLLDGEIKISRKKIAKRYLKGEITQIIAPKVKEGELTELEKQILSAFAEALQREDTNFSIDADFFTDLGGTSLDYFALIDGLSAKFGIDQAVLRSYGKTTVRGFAEKI